MVQQGGVIVVGRVTEVQQKDAALILSSRNLLLGELRSLSAEGERVMRGFSQKGDLIRAQGQAVLSDELSLCTGGV